MKNLLSLFVVVFLSVFFTQALQAKECPDVAPPVCDAPADVTFCVELSAVIVNFQICWEAMPAPTTAGNRSQQKLSFEKSYSATINDEYMEVNGFTPNVEGAIITSPRKYVEGKGYLRKGTYTIVDGKLKIPFESLDIRR